MPKKRRLLRRKHPALSQDRPNFWTSKSEESLVLLDLLALKMGDSRGIAFAVERLSAGAQALRDMIVDAWFDSEQTPVGYPMVNVRDIESGKVRVTRDLFGAD